MNVYVISNECALYTCLMSHIDWLNSVSFSTEDLTLMKLLKTWRRCKDLKHLKSEIIEFLVQLSGEGYLSSKVK